jgi:predicted phage-related endonuclease
MIERIQIDPRRDREAWLALRRQDITASDVGSVCGAGLFGGSPVKVWAEKLGHVAPQEMTAAMQRGRWAEAAVFEALEDQHPDWEIRRAKTYYRDPVARLGATPDGAAIIPGIDGVVVIQAKVVIRPAFEAHWRTDPDDEFSPIIAPLAYQLQTLTEAMLTDSPHAMIVALVIDTFKRWELHCIPIERNPPAEQRIREMVAEFREKYLDTGIQPPVDPERDEAIMKSLWPKDNGIEIDLSGDNEIPMIVADLERARGNKKTWTEAESFCKTLIADKMQDAAIARLADGRRISFKTSDVKAYSVAARSQRVMRILKA